MSLLDEYIDTTSFTYIIFVALFVYWLWSRRRFYIFALKYPGKFGLPFIGFILDIKNVDFLLPATTKSFAACNADTILVWWGTHPMIQSQDPIIVEKILSSPCLLAKAYPLYEALNYAMQRGLVTCPVSEWKRHRKAINPAFSQKTLTSFFPIFNKAKIDFVKKFENLAKSNENGEIKASMVIAMGMVRVAAKTVFGMQSELEDNVIEKFETPYALMFRKVAVLTIHSVMNTFQIFKYDWSIKKSLKTFHGLSLNLLKETFERGKQNKFSENDESSGGKPTLFIDVLYDQWRDGNFSWQEVVAETNTMIIASIETTSNALFSALVMLAMHHPVQQKLYEELTTVFSGKDIDVEYEHLSKLPYLDMVIKETLRLAPSVPTIGRQIVEDFEIEKGVIVPKGVQFLISVFHVHRNKKFWGPNADKFDPENFSAENQAKRHSHAFIPFSKGLRNCVGYRYAMFAMKIMLIGLVYNFEFDTDFKYEDLEIVNHMTLAYKKEPPIKVKPRAAR